MTAQVLHFPSQEAMYAYIRGEAVAEVVMGGAVRPHVQAFADAVVKRFPDIGTIGTYPGHDPSMELALDVFPRDRAQGDELAEWAVANIEPFAIDYVIWWQRIYNPEFGKYWRDMEDRGSITQNHKDHNHYSFEPTGSAVPDEEDDMGTPFDPDNNERDALIRDSAAAWAEFKDGRLRPPQLVDIENRLVALEAKGNSNVTVGTFAVTGSLDIKDIE